MGEISKSKKYQTKVRRAKAYVISLLGEFAQSCQSKEVTAVLEKDLHSLFLFLCSIFNFQELILINFRLTWRLESGSAPVLAEG